MSPPKTLVRKKRKNFLGAHGTHTTAQDKGYTTAQDKGSHFKQVRS